jgi:hypothetical protein
LNWLEGFYRRDIGHKVTDKWELFLDFLKEGKF